MICKNKKGFDSNVQRLKSQKKQLNTKFNKGEFKKENNL